MRQVSGSAVTGGCRLALRGARYPPARGVSLLSQLILSIGTGSRTASGHPKRSGCSLAPPWGHRGAGGTPGSFLHAAASGWAAGRGAIRDPWPNLTPGSREGGRRESRTEARREESQEERKASKRKGKQESQSTGNWAGRAWWSSGGWRTLDPSPAHTQYWTLNQELAQHRCGEYPAARRDTRTAGTAVHPHAQQHPRPVQHDSAAGIFIGPRALAPPLPPQAPARD